MELSLGSSGPEVVRVQQALFEHSGWLGPLDGEFGADFAEAVKAFQRYEHLEASGAVDDATAHALGLDPSAGYRRRRGRA